MDFFSQLLFGGSSRGLVEAALLIGLFWAAIMRPEQIRSKAAFTASGIVLGLALVVPALTQILTIGLRSDATSRQPNTSSIESTLYMMAIPPVLTMIAIILGLSSVLPGKKKTEAKV
jgi:cytochrome bd-type quinol oxidase subunit 2